MTIRIPEDGNDKPDNAWSTNYFASAWPQHQEASTNNQTSRQNQFQSFTGVRINMAGELLNGMMNGDNDSSIESEEMLDSVEFGVKQDQRKAGNKRKADTMKKAPPPPPIREDPAKMSPNKETYDTYETSSDEDEARIDGQQVEIIFGHTERRRREREEEERKKQLRYDHLRFWKSPEKMVCVFLFIMIIFILLSFWERIFGYKFLSWDANQ